MKNPHWERDELILALDLYFRLKSGQVSPDNKKVIELSRLLQSFHSHSSEANPLTVRNANGVSLKLCNFLAIDPNYLGAGMQAYSKLDREVFEEFADDKERLARLASQIRTLVTDGELAPKLRAVSVDDTEYAGMEGGLILRHHISRERDRKIVARKKKQVFEQTGALICEVCGFDFEKAYGSVGKGYIECHHNVPLSRTNVVKKTLLSDLSLVCANCHRVLHRIPSDTTVEDLCRLLHTANRP